ncbi:hypothetical protein J3R82DRAFT_1348 [Butyriboletus roseoflavus]|nr:hypothetical protein J3R82DRAFT_1348 [Butyriboletus roseoflavus]
MSSESSRTDDAFLQSSLPPPVSAAVKKKARSTSAKRGGTSTTTQAHTATVQSIYDPQTCSFIIQCVVHRPNGTNSPFKILSQITYDKLCMAVAEKLKCFPGTLTSISA